MSFTVTGTNLDAPDAGELAAFYRQLLGWSAETEKHYVPPVWPTGRPR